MAALASGDHDARVEVAKATCGKTLSLALTVAVAIKVVGVLLIAAMLVIPPAAARPLTRAPETMAVVAACIGATSALAGLGMSFLFDTPTGPSIVCVAAVTFAITAGLRARFT
ncbi:MAG: metal ABC transporter permease [Marinibacterium sp.]|nr:metal ABC transporter permease [Marinibacterium sp.]